jgi:arginyl-tRNA synthetase
MASLLQKLSDRVGQAFVAQGLDSAFGRVMVSDRPDLAQFQCNGAMNAAKAAKKNPREVAGAIVETLSAQDIFTHVSIAGPGFINLNISDVFLAGHHAEQGHDPREGVPLFAQGETAILDYGGPNIAKAMHVGHLRAAIIGDSVRRIMTFAGYKTLGDVHMGDWGTHMGMLIGDYIRRGETDLVTQTNINDAESVQALMEDMAVRYPKAAGEAKADPALMQEAQENTVKLQDKAEPYYSLWQMIRRVSVVGMKRNYDALGVHFDLWKGEADVHDYIAPMVGDLKGKGIAELSDGAVVVPVAMPDDKKEMPPMILYKRDGAVMYGTTDMATLVERMKLYQPSKIVYIVDQRQNLHFEQVFRAARKAQIVPGSVELTHAGFGTMNGTDGKPFKTREGGVMRLEDLIDITIEKARARMAEAHVAEDFDTAERDDVAHKVAIAAIKFADLQNARQADYVFDLDRLSRFEGKTGPYLLYQAVRIKSLLRRAEKSIDFKASLILNEPDRPLALLLAEFPEAVEAALKNYAPHYLCEYAFRLAQTFSSFYGNCHILSETNVDIRNSRLALCAMTCRQMNIVLSLLGIEIPERM